MEKQYSSVTLNAGGKFKSCVKDETPDLPSHYAKKLQSHLHDITKRYYKNKRKVPLSDNDVEHIRNEFFQFFVGVF